MRAADGQDVVLGGGPATIRQFLAAGLVDEMHLAIAPVLLGEGEVPVRDMLERLAAGGYPHWISVEWEKRWHPEIEEPEVALPQHLDLLTKWLEAP